uniref:Uncharacterized protein n=1 Tax=Tetranychus urticae TaxID=32264 RepID=T1JX48_TETUR
MWMSFGQERNSLLWKTDPAARPPSNRKPEARKSSD